MNAALGHEYPAVATFGLPCPTTIFTLGLLWWVRGGNVRILVVIPLLWSAGGGSAGFALAVPQDLGLLIAGVVSLILLKRRVSTGRRPRRFSLTGMKRATLTLTACLALLSCSAPPQEPVAETEAERERRPRTQPRTAMERYRPGQHDLYDGRFIIEVLKGL